MTVSDRCELGSLRQKHTFVFRDVGMTIA